MKTTVEKLPKSTIKLTVTVPSDKVKETYSHVLDEAAKSIELPGFRKGMAPKELVEEKADVSKLYGEVINHLLETYYPQALKENLISPVSNPKVEIKEFDLEKDFEFVATVAVRPKVTIGEFKSKLKELLEIRKKKRSEENAEKLRKGEKIDDSHIHLSSNEVIEAVINSSQVEIADILLEEETDRLMSRLVDQAQSIGLSLEQYLKAQNRTAEQLRSDYTKSAEKSLKAEFLLSHLVKDEKIETTDEDIIEAYVAAGEPNPEEKLKNEVEKWYIKSILEKNKLVSKIVEEIEGEKHDH